MTVEDIRKIVVSLVPKYPISKIVLFGSRASGKETADSDVDLIMEFYSPVTLITLASIRYELEDALGVSVDVIHGPIVEDDMIEVNEEVVLYAA
ncbi:MAG: nucleotidyltransferase domain-containing protein [Lachnospiraceae bacterium]|nr:nucleotidyltransferase domain-containing protein [Lachnospiraceae bacterium]